MPQFEKENFETCLNLNLFSMKSASFQKLSIEYFYTQNFWIKIIG